MAIKGSILWDEETISGDITVTLPGGRRWYINQIVVHCVAADTITVKFTKLNGSGAQIVFYAVLDAGDTAFIDGMVANQGDIITITATTTTTDVTIFGGQENV
jgi:hypothetical protein